MGEDIPMEQVWTWSDQRGSPIYSMQETQWCARIGEASFVDLDPSCQADSQSEHWAFDTANRTVYSTGLWVPNRMCLEHTPPGNSDLVPQEFLGVSPCTGSLGQQWNIVDFHLIR